MPQGMLEVVIVDASGLEKTDFLSSTDAYCLVSCQDQEKNSKVATVEGSAPTWNETFMFSISENVKELKIKIMDKDTLSADDLVGEVTIPLEPAYEVEKVPVTMYNVVKDEILCGGLNVSLTFTQQKVQSRGFSGDLFRNNIGRLPYDILIKIFSRMPIMSLMSLREVEKSWRHIIDTANFNTKEFNLAVGICDRNCTEIRLFDILEDSIGGEISSFKVAEFSTIIGSVDGFLVVVDPEQINIINPLMNQVLCYLKPYGGYSMIRTLVYGFGKTVDSVYKLLVIRQEKGDLVTDCTLTTVGGEAHWRSLVIKDTYQYDFGDGLVYLNSHQHWLVSEPRKEHPSMVCAFNFDTEKFRYFSMPEIFLSPTDRLEGGTRASAFILDDKLCVCVPTTQFISIWKMEQYGDVLSWTRSHKIRSALFDTKHRSFFPVYFLNNGHIILLVDFIKIVIYFTEEEELGSSCFEFYEQVSAVSHRFSTLRLRANDHEEKSK